MPEHDAGPEVDDLDDAFEALMRDVGARSRPPGAEGAVRTAGLRRTALVSGVLVVVLAVAGGFGLTTLRGQQYQGVPVAGAPTAAGPTALTLERFNEASAGWTTWEQGAAEFGVGSCRTEVTPEPSGQTSEEFHAGAGTNASLRQLRFASKSDANSALRSTVEGLGTCLVEPFSSNISADLQVLASTSGSGDRRTTVWLVGYHDRVDILTTLGAPAPSTDVLEAVSRLLSADVQFR